MKSAKPAMTLVMLMIAAVPAGAQTGRAYVGAAFGMHSEDADHVTGRVPAIGVAGGVRLTSSWGVEVEAGRPTNVFTREYTGFGVTFAPPGASRAEIERLGVFERFTKEREVRATVSVGAVYQPHVHPRVQPRLFMGVFNHAVRDRFATTILRLPEDVPPEQLQSARPIDTRHTRNIGGPSLGGGVAIALTRRLSISPELRYDFGSIGDEINNAWRTSVRAVWSF